MFGLELRRKNNITDLYKDVGTVLEKAGVANGVVSVDIQRASVAHSLQKMLAGNYFNVCTVRDCSQLVGMNIPTERLNVYQTQHCVSWSDMLPEYKQVLVAMILDDFKDVLNPAQEVVPATT